MSKRGERLEIRVSADQLRWWRWAAGHVGLGLAEWLRRLADGEADHAYLQAQKASREDARETGRSGRHVAAAGSEGGRARGRPARGPGLGRGVRHDRRAG